MHFNLGKVLALFLIFKLQKPGVETFESHFILHFGFGEI